MATVRGADNQAARDQRLRQGAAVAAVALVASAAGILNLFAFDDVHLIQGNVRVHSLANWREILTTPFWPPPFSQDLYRPLTSLLLALQHGLGGGDPIIYRLVSYALYAACSVAVLAVARLWLAPGASLVAALLFAAHPVHVEAVALGVGQSELLVGLLAMVMVLRYVRARRLGALTPREMGILAALYAAASLSKEQGLVLPALLLLVELAPPAGVVAQAWRKALTPLVPTAAVAAAVLAARQAVLGGEVAGTFTAEALTGLDAGGRALTMLPVVLQWARLLAWPLHLQADYSPQEIVAATGFGLGQALGLVLLGFGAAAAWWGRRRAPAVTIGLGWCAVALFPVSNLVVPTGIVLAERTLFLPSVGWLLAAVGGAAWMAVRAEWRAPALRSLVALLLVSGMLRSAERQRIWRSEAFFSVRTVQDAPLSYRAQRGYAEVLFAIGRDSLAVEAYQRAVALAPSGFAWRVRNDLARRYRVMGASGPEVDQLTLSLAERPDQEDSRGYLITALLVLGRYKEAIAEADSALARGGNRAAFGGVRALADSAERIGAPPGTVRVGVSAGAVRPIR
jgi:tetratricopeptide (TPR) repeat protein